MSESTASAHGTDRLWISYPPISSALTGAPYRRSSSTMCGDCMRFVGNTLQCRKNTWNRRPHVDKKVADKFSHDGMELTFFIMARCKGVWSRQLRAPARFQLLFQFFVVSKHGSRSFTRQQGSRFLLEWPQTWVRPFIEQSLGTFQLVAMNRIVAAQHTETEDGLQSSVADDDAEAKM
jgi:hypothetical protein